MSKPERIGNLIGDYTLYEVPTTCRDCGAEYMGKAFQPADGRKRWGQCEGCGAIAEAPKLPAPPKDVDLQPPRRTWEQDH